MSTAGLWAWLLTSLTVFALCTFYVFTAERPVSERVAMVVLNLWFSLIWVAIVRELRRRRKG
jgi:hypothetical protein